MIYSKKFTREMQTFKILRRIIFVVSIIISFQSACFSQIGAIDDIFKLGRKLDQLSDLNSGLKMAKYADKIGNLKKPITASAREKFNISLYDVAYDNIFGIQNKAVSTRFYFCMENDDLIFVTDKLDELSEIGLVTGSYEDFLRYSRKGIFQSDIDIIVEADVLQNPVYKSLFKIEEQRIYLPNFEGNPWRLRKLPESGRLVSEMRPNLFVGLDEASSSDILPYLDISFSTSDVKVISLFDEVSDNTTIDVLNTSLKYLVPYENVFVKEELLKSISKGKGKIIAIVGHVEGKDFVIRNDKNNIISRVSIQELHSAAAKKQSSILFLGCETSRVTDVSGYLEEVNSLSVADQLKRAARAENYGDFFSSLGTVDSPFVLTNEVVENAQHIVARRIDENRRIRRSSINTIAISTPLTRSQVVVTSQLVRQLPKWLDDTLSIIIGVIVFALAISIFSSSWKPIQYTITILISIIVIPYSLFSQLYNWVIKPKANMDRVNRSQNH